jgi:hypothetical protein
MVVQRVYALSVHAMDANCYSVSDTETEGPVCSRAEATGLCSSVLWLFNAGRDQLQSGSSSSLQKVAWGRLAWFE